MYNIMTCEGWATSMPCSLAWFSLALLFMLILVLRRQCDDGIFSGVGFEHIGAMVGGLGVTILIITFTGSIRWAFLGGIIGLAIGGFVLGGILRGGAGE
jgi:hypothetical protein